MDCCDNVEKLWEDEGCEGYCYDPDERLLEEGEAHDHDYEALVDAHPQPD